MADNLKNYGSFIPGYRPGRRTADYLEKVMVRITYVGAGFLAVVAIIPTIVSVVDGRRLHASPAFYGGTSLLIAVSVAFDLVQKIDSHLVMRNYSGSAGSKGDASMRIVFIGPPGPAKERRPSGWSPTYRMAHLRPATCSARPATPRPTLGLKADKYMSAGELVPDDMIIDVIGERLATAGLPAGLPAGRLSAHDRPGRGPGRDAGASKERRWTWCWNCRCRKRSCSGGWPAAAGPTTSRR